MLGVHIPNNLALLPSMNRKRINPESLPEIARRLRVLREALGYETQGQMAAELGMTSNSWNNYERGFSRINLDAGLAIQRRWGVPLDWLYIGSTAMLPAHLAEKIRRIESRETPKNGQMA
jgi:transcriptional regulator with XRE-family HTH domain